MNFMIISLKWGSEASPFVYQVFKEMNCGRDGIMAWEFVAKIRSSDVENILMSLVAQALSEDL